MMYKAKVAVCSEICTRHSTQSERHVEFLNVKSGWYVKKPLGFERLKCTLLILKGVIKQLDSITHLCHPETEVLL